MTNFRESAASHVREETGERESSYKDSTSIQSLPPYRILKIHFNIILPSTPRSTQWSSYRRVPHQTSMHLASPPYVPHGRHISFSWFDHQNNIGEEYRSLSSSLSSPLQSPISLSLLDLNIFLSTLFSNTLSLHSSILTESQALLKSINSWCTASK